MENSIESIWKKGFMNDHNIVIPEIIDLYNQKSIHAIDKVKRMFRVNQIVIVIMVFLIPVIHYFVDAIWQGTAASILLLLTFWYNKRLYLSIPYLDQGATSLDYLKSFDTWLKEVLYKSEKIVLFSYPLYVLISISTIWSVWNKQGLISKLQEKFPGSFIFEHFSIFVLVFSAVIVLLMVYFSKNIYKWEVRLMYGRVFDKLEKTIIELEILKKG